MNATFHGKQEVAEAQRVVNLHLTIQDRIQEAAWTLRKLPREEERRYLSSGERCSWPSYVRDWMAYGADTAKAPRIPPSPDHIDRMNEALGWIAWLATQSEHEAKAVWFTFGARAKTGHLAKVLRVSRESIRRWRKDGCEKLVKRYGLSACVRATATY